MTRYVVYGAGAVGGTIGGRLHAAGRDVVLIARGDHLAALQRDGLRLRSPDADRTLPVPAVGSPREAEIGPDDVVLLCMKTQDTEAALGELVAAAPATIGVACVQNGVENERLVLRRFATVYGVLVYLPAQHLAPGVVAHMSEPSAGVLDVGTYPPSDAPGALDGAVDIALDLTAAGFASQVSADVMGWKHRKILSNLSNAIEAAVGPGERGGELHERARAEGLACYAAAGIAIPSDADEAARRTQMSAPRPVDGDAGTSSSWQSLARGGGRIEADWLNGEIVLLGRRHDVPTPVNAALQRIANRLARERRPPGSMTVAELTDAVARGG
jgi:2-dehydropantoate 2-reductase